jgi:hypothetical protein
MSAAATTRNGEAAAERGNESALAVQRAAEVLAHIVQNRGWAPKHHYAGTPDRNKLKGKPWHPYDVAAMQGVSFIPQPGAEQPISDLHLSFG